MIYGIILAGGRGERFWPLSTRVLPKQLLPIISERPMIVETVDRISSIIPIDNIIIVAGQELEAPIRKLFSGAHLLLEPFGRNTTCAIAYASTCMKDDDIMVVLPADHYIPDKEQFLKTLNKAIEVAKDNWLVTFGIVPTRAEIGYGYIELGNMLTDTVYEVKTFKEKPNQKQAQKFLREGKYLWNSGMFVWRRGKILSEIQTHMPEFYIELKKIMSDKISLNELYANAPNISIDYSIMEKTETVAVIKSDFLWDDIGSWLALERIYKSDRDNNISIGLHKSMDTKNCIIVSNEGIVSTIGVTNLIVVRKGDAVFVCDKRKVSEIKKLIYLLSQDNNLNKYL